MTAHIRNLAPSQLCNISVVDNDFARCRSLLMHNEFKKCTLACARCTDNKYKLALINTQRNTVESMRAIRVCLDTFIKSIIKSPLFCSYYTNTHKKVKTPKAQQDTVLGHTLTKSVFCRTCVEVFLNHKSYLEHDCVLKLTEVKTCELFNFSSLYTRVFLCTKSFLDVSETLRLFSKKRWIVKRVS